MTSVGVFLPAVEERASLLETIQILRDRMSSPFHLYIISDSAQRCREISEYLDHSGIPKKLFTCEAQSEPLLSGAIKTGIKLVEEDLFVLMASDLETDPNLVPQLIEKCMTEGGIVTVSRWLAPRAFRHYGFARLVANFVFQWLARIRYRRALSDFTYGFRVYPTHVLKSMHLRESGHPMLLEMLLRPLFDGHPITEVPGTWRPRKEGFSKKAISQNFSYLRLMLFGPRNK